MEDEQIRVDAIAGKDILQYEGLVERMFEIYVSTIDKMYWGRQYLTLEFFQLLAKSDFVKNLCFMCARHRSTGDKLRAEDVFAGTVNIVKDGVFYGRYWGCLPGKEVKNLHFETCYWSAIDYCIKNGLKRMEPGAGGGGECPEVNMQLTPFALFLRLFPQSLDSFFTRLQMGERFRPGVDSFSALHLQPWSP
jgi:predicted N-acyltransferase